MISVANESISLQNEKIVVHAVGSGYGESIVVTIGGRLMIGIDCCSTLVEPTMRGRSYFERIISDEMTVVWVLTHFHFDHFRSFTTLLDQIGSRLNRLVVPGDYLSADMAFYLADDAESDAGLAAFHVAKDEYARLRRRLGSAVFSGIIGTKIGDERLVNVTLRSPTGRKIPMRCDLFGPDYALTARLMREAHGEAKDGIKKRSKANHTSYIVRLRAGEFDSLFLGDTPAEDSITRAPHCSEATKLFLLKVAHHGAADGTTTNLLQNLGKKARRRVAMICPFKAHGLPEDSVLDMLKEAGFKTKISGPERPSPSLKAQILSRTDLPTTEPDWDVYSHEASVRVIRSQL